MRTYCIAQGTLLSTLWWPKWKGYLKKEVHAYAQLIDFAAQQKLTQHGQAAKRQWRFLIIIRIKGGKPTCWSVAISEIISCCSSSHSAHVTLAFLLYLQYAAPQGFCTCCPLHLKLLPQISFLTGLWFASSLPAGLCSNTFLSGRPSLLPSIKEQGTATIKPTVIFPHLPPGTRIYLKISRLSLIFFQDGSS